MAKKVMYYWCSRCGHASYWKAWMREAGCPNKKCGEGTDLGRGNYDERVKWDLFRKINNKGNGSYPIVPAKGFVYKVFVYGN